MCLICEGMLLYEKNEMLEIKMTCVKSERVGKVVTAGKYVVKVKYEKHRVYEHVV